MFDNEIMVRSGTTHLTADESGSYVAYPKCVEPMELRVVVPTMAEASDTIDITVTWSADGSNPKEIEHMTQITYANVVTSKLTEFFMPMTMHRAYFKVDIDITDADTGSDFDAGHVHIGLVPAGRHTVRAGGS
jgi:hypothetical protein